MLLKVFNYSLFVQMFGYRQTFFNNLYHRFLINAKMEMKTCCLRVMTLVYGKYHEDIGPFSDTKVILGLLDRVSVDGTVYNEIYTITWCYNTRCPKGPISPP